MAIARPVCGPISTFSRVQILHLVQSRPDRTVGEICDATALHPNTVREHLQRLIEGGYVIAATERRTTRGRPRGHGRAGCLEPGRARQGHRRRPPRRHHETDAAGHGIRSRQ